MPPEPPDWNEIIRLLYSYLDRNNLPSVNMLAQNKPWECLVSTLISLRTRDQVTTEATERLLARFPDAAALSEADESEIASLIYPAGFYRVKAGRLKKIAEIILDSHDGKVPSGRQALTSLPGVGLKTANLVLSAGFGIPAICVDIHVHRISNRMGWISTASPDRSEAALSKILPRKYWIDINMLLVNFGQKICTPASPWCSKCALAVHCSRTGVSRSR